MHDSLDLTRIQKLYASDFVKWLLISIAFYVTIILGLLGITLFWPDSLKKPAKGEPLIIILNITPLILWLLIFVFGSQLLSYLKDRASFYRIHPHLASDFLQGKLILPRVRNYAFPALWIIGLMLGVLISATISYFVFRTPYIVPLLLIGTVIILDIRLRRWMAEENRKGHYEAIIQRARWLREKRIRTRGIVIPEIFAAYQLDNKARRDEVFGDILKSCCETGDIKTLEIALYHIAIIRLTGEEYQTSLPMLEDSLYINPYNLAVVGGLMVWYLEQKLHPERVLELIDYAHNVKIAQSAQYFYLAGQAYALALSGQGNEARQILHEQLNIDKNAIENNTPATAEPLRYIGLTAHILGDTELAHHCLQRVSQLDPEGVQGKRAHQSLAELTANEG